MKNKIRVIIFAILFTTQFANAMDRSNNANSEINEDVLKRYISTIGAKRKYKITELHNWLYSAISLKEQVMAHARNNDIKMQQVIPVDTYFRFVLPRDITNETNKPKNIHTDYIHYFYLQYCIDKYFLGKVDNPEEYLTNIVAPNLPQETLVKLQKWIEKDIAKYRDEHGIKTPLPNTTGPRLYDDLEKELDILLKQKKIGLHPSPDQKYLYIKDAIDLRALTEAHARENNVVLHPEIPKSLYLIFSLPIKRVASIDKPNEFLHIFYLQYCIDKYRQNQVSNPAEYGKKIGLPAKMPVEIKQKIDKWLAKDIIEYKVKIEKETAHAKSAKNNASKVNPDRATAASSSQILPMPAIANPEDLKNPDLLDTLVKQFGESYRGFFSSTFAQLISKIEYDQKMSGLDLEQKELEHQKEINESLNANKKLQDDLKKLEREKGHLIATHEVQLEYAKAKLINAKEQLAEAETKAGNYCRQLCLAEENLTQAEEKYRNLQSITSKQIAVLQKNVDSQKSYLEHVGNEHKRLEERTLLAENKANKLRTELEKHVDENRRLQELLTDERAKNKTISSQLREYKDNEARNNKFKKILDDANKIKIRLNNRAKFISTKINLYLVKENIDNNYHIIIIESENFNQPMLITNSQESLKQISLLAKDSNIHKNAFLSNFYFNTDDSTISAEYKLYNKNNDAVETICLTEILQNEQNILNYGVYIFNKSRVDSWMSALGLSLQHNPKFQIIVQKPTLTYEDKDLLLSNINLSIQSNPNNKNILKSAEELIDLFGLYSPFSAHASVISNYLKTMGLFGSRAEEIAIKKFPSTDDLRQLKALLLSKQRHLKVSGHEMKEINLAYNSLCELYRLKRIYLDGEIYTDNQAYLINPFLEEIGLGNDREIVTIMGKMILNKKDRINLKDRIENAYELKVAQIQNSDQDQIEKLNNQKIQLFSLFNL